MNYRRFGVLGLWLFLGSNVLFAQSQPDVKTRIKLFCDEKVKLTEASIKFDVQKLVSLEAGVNSAAAVDSVSTVQIATMHLNCNLLVGGFISSDQFLAKQTEILQFAVDLETARQEAEAKKAAATKTNPSPSGSGGTGSQVAANSQSPSEATTKDASGASKDKAKENAPAPSTSQKPAGLDLNAIAKDLGVTVKKKAAVSQSGSEDLVQSSMQRLIQDYSPIKPTS